MKLLSAVSVLSRESNWHCHVTDANYPDVNRTYSRGRMDYCRYQY